MTRAVLADSGPLYAANDVADEHHERALRELEELARARRNVLIAYPILLEAYSLLLFRMGRKAAMGWLDELSAASFVTPMSEDYQRGMAMVRILQDQNITLVDATLAAVATRMKLSVWTYDHHFDTMQVPVWR